MFKLLLILIIAYFVFRTIRNLLVAAVKPAQGLEDAEARDHQQREAAPARDDRRKEYRDVEDAVWKDLP